MKIPKFALMLAALAMFSMAGCGGGGGEQKEPPVEDGAADGGAVVAGITD